MWYIISDYYKNNLHHQHKFQQPMEIRYGGGMVICIFFHKTPLEVTFFFIPPCLEFDSSGVFLFCQHYSFPSVKWPTIQVRQLELICFLTAAVFPYVSSSEYGNWVLSLNVIIDNLRKKWRNYVTFFLLYFIFTSYTHRIRRGYNLFYNWFFSPWSTFVLSWAYAMINIVGFLYCAPNRL